MSIIFEALRKIEREKKGEPSGCPDIIFMAPDEAHTPEARHGIVPTALAAAAIGIPFALFFAVILRPDWLGLSVAPRQDSAAPQAAPSSPPAMREVWLETKKMLPAFGDMPAKMPSEPVPVQPAAGQRIELPELRLKGVSRSGNRSWAFINDRMLKVGDVIDGAEVVAILNDRVRLRCNGVEFTLTY